MRARRILRSGVLLTIRDGQPQGPPQRQHVADRFASPRLLVERFRKRTAEVPEVRVRDAALLAQRLDPRLAGDPTDADTLRRIPRASIVRPGEAPCAIPPALDLVTHDPVPVSERKRVVPDHVAPGHGAGALQNRELRDQGLEEPAVGAVVFEESADALRTRRQLGNGADPGSLRRGSRPGDRDAALGEPGLEVGVGGQAEHDGEGRAAERERPRAPARRRGPERQRQADQDAVFHDGPPRQRPGQEHAEAAAVGEGKASSEARGGPRGVGAVQRGRGERGPGEPAPGEEPCRERELDERDRRGQRRDQRFRQGAVRAKNVGEPGEVQQLPGRRREQYEPDRPPQREREPPHGRLTVQSYGVKRTR